MTEMAEGLMEMAAMMAPILEAVEGYRANLDAKGWGDALSRKMAADYHAFLL